LKAEERRQLADEQDRYHESRQTWAAVCRNCFPEEACRMRAWSLIAGMLNYTCSDNNGGHVGCCRTLLSTCCRRQAASLIASQRGGVRMRVYSVPGCSGRVREGRAGDNPFEVTYHHKQHGMSHVFTAGPASREALIQLVQRFRRLWPERRYPPCRPRSRQSVRVW
jgi:hypothetical protein